MASRTRGVWGAGYPLTDAIDYVTITSTGSAADFGNLHASGESPTGCSDGIRGVFMGGSFPSASNVIQYVTIASTGNAADFGDMTTAARDPGALASSTRGLIGGGTTPSLTNFIDYITIASTGNAADFGDLTQTRWGVAGCSGD